MDSTQCSKCTAMVRVADMPTHLAWHTANDAIRCTKCASQVKSGADMTTHLAWHTKHKI